MSNSLRYINVIEMVEVNGCYLEEHRCHCDRRKTVKRHIRRYDRRSHRSRRYQLQIDVKI